MSSLDDTGSRPPKTAPEDCADTTFFVTARISGEISRNEAEALDRHLAVCEACRAEAARIERTWNLLGELPETVPGAAYRAVTLGLLEDAVISRRVVRMMPRKSFFQRPALQAAAIVLAALGGFAVARSGTFTGQVAANPDPKKTAQDPTPVAYFPGADGKPRVSNVTFAPAGSGGSYEVTFDAVTKHRIVGKADDPLLASLVVSLVASPSENEGERRRALDLVSQQVATSRTATPEIVQVLVKTLTTDKNPSVRKRAAEALAKLPPSPEVRDAFVTALAKDTNPAVRILAVESLARAAQTMRDETIIKTLKERASDAGENGYVRDQAATALRVLSL